MRGSDKILNRPKSFAAGINQAYRRYEQVNKEQTYHFSEQEGQDEFDDEFEIKTCDFGKWLHGSEMDRQQFANEFGQALEDIGFAVLENHGIPASFYQYIEDKIRAFFGSVPEEDRQPYLAQRHGSVNQGYFPLLKTTNIHPDLVEGWVFCRRAFNLDDAPDFDAIKFWPLAEYEAIFREVVKKHEMFIRPIMQSMLRYLGVDQHLYDDKLTATNFGFRLNYYPVQKGGDVAANGGRMLGHEDVDLFTILPASSGEGLQVLNRRNMKWIRLSPPQGSIIINTGDYMQRISNDRLPSTTHRVGKANSLDSNPLPRVSFPMAVYVWEDEILEVLPNLGEPKYAPIRAEEFHTHITSKYYGDDYNK